MEEKKDDLIPLKVETNENLIRIKYIHIPESVMQIGTESRTVIHDEDNPDTGYIVHALNNGQTARFKGTWKTNNSQKDPSQECALIIKDGQVTLVPFSNSLIHVRKV